MYSISTELYKDVWRLAVSEAESLSNARASLEALRPQTRTIVVAITAPKAVKSQDGIRKCHANKNPS